MKHIYGGFILLARQMIGSDIWGKPSDYLKIWIFILCKVNHKDNLSFKKGENFFNWSEDIKELRGVKIKTVYNCLNWLKSSTQISTQKSTRGMIIKVLNYGQYQNISNYQLAHEVADVLEFKENRQHTINKNDNNNNNDSILSGFNQFYESYPRKEQKKKAEQAYLKHIKAGVKPEDIMAGLQRYKAEVKDKEKRFIAHPTTWLNGERWNDEYEKSSNTDETTRKMLEAANA